MGIHILVLGCICSFIFLISSILEVFTDAKPVENDPEPEPRTCPHDKCQANKRIPPQSDYLERELKLQVNYYQKLFLESQGFKFDGAFDNTVIFYMTGGLPRVYRTHILEDVIHMYKSGTAFPTSDWVDYEN